MVHIVSGVQIFSKSNIWNTPVSDLPIHRSSSSYITGIGGSSTQLRAKVSTPSFVPPTGWGFPINLVTNSTPTYSPTFSFAPPRSVAGLYPIPSGYSVEDGSDKHYIALNTDTGLLYEIDGLTGSAPNFTATSGGIWDTTSNTLPAINATWGDAASMSLLAGLIMYDEVLTGSITHALRASIPNGSGTYIWPAVHSDGNNSSAPPHGSRLRLKSNFDVSNYSTTNQIILNALKTYGLYIVDTNASTELRLYGVPDTRWSDNDLQVLNTYVTANNFEVIDTSSQMINVNSGQALPFKYILFPSTDRRGLGVSNYAEVISSDAPYAWYRLNEKSGSVISDSTSRLHNGTVSGSVSYGNSGPLINDSDTSLGFYPNSVAGQVTLSKVTNGSGLSALSVECWVKFSSTSFPSGFANILISGTTSATHVGYSLYASSSSGITFAVGNGTSTSICSAFSFPPMNTTSWFHIVGTYNGSTIKLYVNGSLIISSSLSGAIGTTSVSPTIGSNSSSYFPGFIKDVSIWQVELTQTQVTNHYQSGAIGKQVILFPSTDRRQN